MLLPDWSKGAMVKALLLLGVLVYLPSLENPFIWDDEAFITDNVYAQLSSWRLIFTMSTTAGAGQVSNYYRPLTTLSFAIDRAVWGLNPVGFHVTNTLMHGLAGAVLYLLLEELGGESQGLGGGKKEITKYQSSMTKQIANKKFQFSKPSWLGKLGMPFWVAAVFLVFPTQVETVTYINSRGDSFYALLLFTGLYLFVKSFELNSKSEIRSSLPSYEALEGHGKYNRNFNFEKWRQQLFGNHKVLLAGSVVLYGLAILAKEIAVVVVGLYALVLLVQISNTKLQMTNFSFDELWKKFRSQLGAVVAMVGVLGSYLLLRLTVLNFVERGYNFSEIGGEYATSVWVRLFTFGKIFWTYLRLLVIPYPLHMERTSEVLTTINPWFVGMVAIVVGVYVMGFFEWKKHRTSWIWIGWSWFLVMLSPVSGVVPMNDLLYEHWLYVPMVGFLIFIFGIFNYINHQSPIINKIPINKMTNYMLVGLCVVYVGLSVRQMGVWRDAVEFYRYTLSFGETAKLRNNLCLELAKKGEYGVAKKECERAIELEADSPLPYRTLGGMLLRERRFEEAVVMYGAAIAVEPAYYPAYKALVGMYVSLGEWEEALPVAEKLVELSPGSWEYWTMLGKVKGGLGEVSGAVEAFGRARELVVGDKEAERVIGEVKRGSLRGE